MIGVIINIKSFIHFKSIRKKHGNKIVITIEAMQDEILSNTYFPLSKNKIMVGYITDIYFITSFSLKFSCRLILIL